MNDATETAVPGAPVSATAEHERALAAWQRRLLPFMTRFLVVIAIAFFALTIYNGYEMRSFVSRGDAQSIRDKLSSLAAGDRRGAGLVEQSLLLLEAEAMDKRYQQASALLVSRIFTRQLTFITGMVLAFIGAVFILGKLSEAPTNAELGVEQLKAAITSSSPGLILAFFGTTLIALTIAIQPRIEVQDRPIYFATTTVAAGQPPGAGEVGPEPPDPGLRLAPNDGNAPPTPK